LSWRIAKLSSLFRDRGPGNRDRGPGNRDRGSGTPGTRIPIPRSRSPIPIPPLGPFRSFPRGATAIRLRMAVRDCHRCVLARPFFRRWVRSAVSFPDGGNGDPGPGIRIPTPRSPFPNPDSLVGSVPQSSFAYSGRPRPSQNTPVLSLLCKGVFTYNNHVLNVLCVFLNWVRLVIFLRGHTTPVPLCDPEPPSTPDRFQRALMFCARHLGRLRNAPKGGRTRKKIGGPFPGPKALR
jgi:hypothetical protein